MPSLAQLHQLSVSRIQRYVSEVATVPITRLRCIHTLAIRLDCSTSIPVNCFFPIVKIASDTAVGKGSC